MSATTRHDALDCPECRLSFSSRQALRRHSALDHRPATDGAWITAQLVGASHSADEPRPAGPETGTGLATAPPPAEWPGAMTQPMYMPFLLVLGLALLAALPVLAALTGPVGALWLLTLTCAFWIRWRLPVARGGHRPPRSQAPSPSD